MTKKVPEHETRTVPFTIRLPQEIVEDIKEIAEAQRADKYSWLREAIVQKLLIEQDDFFTQLCDDAIDDYIHARISDEMLLATLNGIDEEDGQKRKRRRDRDHDLTEVPDDLKAARAEVIKRLQQGSKETNKK